MSHPNFNISAGRRRTMSFVVYGPGGPNRPAEEGGPDVDLTSEATLDTLGSGGTVELVPTGDSTPSRTVKYTAGSVAGNIFGARVTARGKSDEQFALIVAAADLSEVDFDESSLSPEF